MTEIFTVRAMCGVQLMFCLNETIDHLDISRSVH